MNRISENTLELLTQIDRKHFGIRKFVNDPDDLKILLTKIEEGGDIFAVPYLPTYLLKLDSRSAILIAGTIDRLLRQIPAASLPQFDERLRKQHWYGSYRDARYRNWYTLSPRQVPALLDFNVFASSLLGVLSFHHNGYVREAATMALDTIKDGSEIPFLLLRANDWVRVIREIARKALMDRCKPDYAEYFTANLPLVTRLESCDRADHTHLINSIVSQLEKVESWRFLLAGIQSEDIKERRAAFFIAIRTSNSKLRIQVIELGIQSQDSLIRVRSAQMVDLITDPNQFELALSVLRADPFMPVRLAGLRYTIELSTDKAVDALKGALLDKHISIREFARFHLNKLEPMDYREFYRGVMSSIQQSRVYAAIGGLGETGVAEDDVLILPYVKHRLVKYRAAALRALAKLNLHQHTETFLTSLEDESPKVSREAVRALLQSRGFIAHQGEIWLLIANDSASHVKLNAFNLLNKLPKWDSIYYILKSAASDDDLLIERANTALSEWWSSYNRSFILPNDYQKKRIRKELIKYPSKDKTRASLEDILKG